jgi:DNA-binding NtrC family response regulator
LLYIAVIDDDNDWHTIMSRDILKAETNVDYFHSHKEFGKADLKKYDLIFIDYNLPGLSGEDIAKVVTSKCEAKVALMSSETGWVSSDIVKNKSIKAVLDKGKLKKFRKFLKDFYSENTTKEYMKKAKQTLKNIKD